MITVELRADGLPKRASAAVLGDLMIHGTKPGSDSGRKGRA